MRVRVKVCGITNHEDAVMALDLGADALGFNFFPPSPRFIDSAAAREIIRRLPPFATTVGVFVNVPDPCAVERTARGAGVQVIQLHGDESAEYCGNLGAWPLIKAVGVGLNWDPTLLDNFSVRTILLDVKDDQRFGGTGQAIDWSLLRCLPAGKRFILAGGLSPVNVTEAIRVVRPYGVDVCSGVESRPGKKDPGKLAAFMDEVLHATK
ncbi:MAG: phosphoribosylanthranilate isomerase [Acidobacteriota bacterium]